MRSMIDLIWPSGIGSPRALSAAPSSFNLLLLLLHKYQQSPPTTSQHGEFRGGGKRRAWISADKSANDVLGVSESSSFAKIKASFRKLAKGTHPDLSHSSSPIDSSKFSQLTRFFLSFLCDVSRISAESVSRRRDRCVSMPTELAAEAATLNHGCWCSKVELLCNITRGSSELQDNAAAKLYCKGS